VPLGAADDRNFLVGWDDASRSASCRAKSTPAEEPLTVRLDTFQLEAQYPIECSRYIRCHWYVRAHSRPKSHAPRLGGFIGSITGLARCAANKTPELFIVHFSCLLLVLRIWGGEQLFREHVDSYVDKNSGCLKLGFGSRSHLCKLMISDKIVRVSTS
jgi:hypothetical protein